MEKKKGHIFVVSAPSGAGKTTIVKSILKDIPELVFSISATTRKKRENETDGVDYHFISEKDFLIKIEKNEFLEFEKFYDYYYGTPKDFINDKINNDISVLLDVDVKGALNIKAIYPEAILVYICPPSFEVLVERLKNRKTEDEIDFKKRVERAKMELSQKDKFDYLVVNNDLNTAISEVKSLIKKILNKES
ncbi:MAG: guanylate kinase [Ignavibacteria bacterium RBG_16_34_14]|nr:MAG: guanylate kinase [Ignavibacteria bacterium RBG_16_34_14]